jgi:hypothetical protein
MLAVICLVEGRFVQRPLYGKLCFGLDTLLAQALDALVHPRPDDVIALGVEIALADGLSMGLPRFFDHGIHGALLLDSGTWQSISNRAKISARRNASPQQKGIQVTLLNCAVASRQPIS